MINVNTNISPNEIKRQVPVSVDCVVFGYNDQGLHILTRQCDMEPFLGFSSLIGDLLHGNENLDQAANRILKERGGLMDIYLEQVHSFSNVDRHPVSRILTVAYYALVPLTDNKMLAAKDNLTQWENIDDIERLAFDHRMILDYCIKRVRERLLMTPVGFKLLPEKFTLPQIQKVFEVILGIKLDKRNFRRKLISLNFLKELNENQTDVSHRPGKLFSIDESGIRNYNLMSLHKM